ncbi:glycosyltransferase family 2 protein [Bacteriovoracales bacterium]|nr:glycosyltransferase family 2 protein [Bacteriovoracales bacterium]
MITFGIFALNEEKNISNTIEVIIKASKNFPNIPFEIIVVDDGSSDSTYEIMKGWESNHSFIRTIKHEKNYGIGKSVKTIVTHAQYPKVGFFPGDNVVGVSMFESFFKYCNEDCFVCYYFVNTEIRPRLRILLSETFTQMCRLLFNIHLKYINGGGIYSTEALRKMDIKSEGYTFTLELSAKTLLSGTKFFEVPCFFQPNHDKSVALKFTNLVKTFYYLIKVYWDIKVTNKETFSKEPERVLRY